MMDIGIEDIVLGYVQYIACMIAVLPVAIPLYILADWFIRRAG
jgi:hypothetical protein